MIEHRTPREVIDGAPVELEPGLSDREIDALGMPGPVPAEIRALLRMTRGITADGIEIAFTGPCGLDAVFPYGVVLASDGAGNEWVCDVLSSGAWDRVYFASHDPPEISIAARDLATFLAEALEGELEPPPFVGVDALREPARCGDPRVRALAERAGEGLDVFDLRRGVVGDGFEWGRAGPTTRVVRAPDTAIWAVERPTPGFFARLFGAR